MVILMKRSWFLIGVVALGLAACDEAAEAPRATAVEEEGSSEAIPPVDPEMPPEPPLIDPEEPSPSVGQRVDSAIEATGRGLQVAGDKTKEGVTSAAEKTEEALHTAGEKTEEGVKKAAEATGGFLKRMGEKLEDAATREPDEDEPAEGEPVE